MPLVCVCLFYVLQSQNKDVFCEREPTSVHLKLILATNILKTDIRRASEISGAVCQKKRNGKKIVMSIAMAHLSPVSSFIFFTISSLKASATAVLIGNPSLDKLMAGWTRSSHGNQPNSFQARYWP